MLVITATINIVEGKADQFISEYHKLAPKVLKDPGAVVYSLHRDLKDPNKLFFYEKYEDQKAMEYHTSTPHFKAFFQAMGPIMKGRPDVNRYEEV